MKTILILSLCFMIMPCLASKVTAIADGDWDDGATWDGVEPGCYDSICIPAGITVTVTSTEDLEACSPIIVFVEGRLEFQTGKKIKLPCGASAIILELGGSLGVGGGGGASTYVTICADVVWDASLGDATGYILLPVELCCFNAEIEDRIGKLKWRTMSEINNAGFEVQKSIDGINWSSLGFIQGAGSSSVTIDYDFVDTNPVLGVNYYRLVQFDFDNREKIYGPILLINGEPELKKDLFVFPNPTGVDRLVIYFDGLGFDELKFNLYSTQGQIVYSGLAPSFNGEYCIVQLPSDLATGTYFIQIGNFIERVIVI